MQPATTPKTRPAVEADLIRNDFSCVLLNGGSLMPTFSASLST